MTTMRWFRTGGPGRGAPAPWYSAKRQRRLVMVIMALGGLTLPGCAALGLPSPCGPCGWMSRVFHPRRAAAGACCPGTEGAVEYGVPGAVVAPGVVPSPPGSIRELTPIETTPSAVPGPDTGASSRGAGKANYETYRPADRSGTSRGRNLARAFIPSEPARPAQRESAAGSNNPLDNLPPLSIPAQTPRAEASPPVAPEAEALPGPVPASESSAAKPGGVPSALQPTVPPPSQPSPNEASPQPDEAAITVTPGIQRFQGLEPKLAGGSLPTLTGLDWLADKGYKTIIDLRDPGPDQPAYIAEVTTRGLRYLALPIAPTAFDADHVNRFNAELDQTDARPLYFCDNNGDRAGALWYIRRLTVDQVKVDPKTAMQEAKDLGLSVNSTWLAATSYIERLGTVKQTSAQGPEAPAPAAAPQPSSTTAAPTTPAPESALPRSAATAAADTPAPNSEPVTSSQIGWRAFGALILTTLGLPLAYWGRSVVSMGFRTVKASLVAPRLSPRSLPGALDA
jgi:protein tyrosine phosphatase (PTP) superfamily phosphohydrolase (DUF442 family)